MIPKHTISAALKNLRREVEVIVYKDEELFEYVRDVFSAVDNVKVGFEDRGDPSLGEGAIRVGKNGRVYFHGFPRYTELESLLTALKILGGSDEGDEGDKSESEVNCDDIVLTFVSTFCPNCRSSVDAINSILHEFECVEHHVVDIEYLPEVAERFRIESVPTTVVDGFRLTGALSKEEAIKLIGIALEKKYDLYFAEKLMIGEIDDVKSLITEKPELIRVLAELISHREFIVRLGAMAVIEALHKQDPRLTEPAKDVIKKMVKHDDVRIREDAVMMLGIIGGEDEIEILREAANEGGRVADSVNEAITNIRERIGK